MRITTHRLRQIIREEARRVLSTTAHTLREGDEDEDLEYDDSGNSVHDTFNTVVDYAWGSSFMDESDPSWEAAAELVDLALAAAEITVTKEDREGLIDMLLDFQHSKREEEESEEDYDVDYDDEDEYVNERRR